MRNPMRSKREGKHSSRRLRGRAPVVAAAALVAAASWATLGSCSSSDETGPSATTAGDASDAPSELPTLDAPTSDAPGPDGNSGGQAACGPPGSEPWSPATSGSWRPVDWTAPCPVELAEEPHKAVPLLEWEPCPWQQGCQYSVIRWTGAYRVRPSGSPSVLRLADGFRVGMYLAVSFVDSATSETSWSTRAVIYDTDGCPMAVWRTSEFISNENFCHVYRPLVTPSHAWVAAALGNDAAAYVIAPYDELTTVSDTLPVTVPNQGSAASDDTLGLWGVTGNRATVYDHSSGVANTFGTPPFPSYKLPRPVGDSALVMCLFDYDRPKACIWNRASHDIEPLVVPTDDVIPNIDSDGQTLVWIRASPVQQPNWAWLDARIWTSPFATHQADLAPEQRCQAPELSIPASRAADGYYAFNTGVEERFHIYRLSDMHHWSFAWPPQDEAWGPAHGVLYLDTEELWYGFANGIARVRLDSLGPGEPCTPP